MHWEGKRDLDCPRRGGEGNQPREETLWRQNWANREESKVKKVTNREQKQPAVPPAPMWQSQQRYTLVQAMLTEYTHHCTIQYLSTYRQQMSVWTDVDCSWTTMSVAMSEQFPIWFSGAQWSSRDFIERHLSEILLWIPWVGEIWIPKVRMLGKMRNANKSEKVNCKDWHCLNMAAANTTI